jgi:hypothetical protein
MATLSPILPQLTDPAQSGAPVIVNQIGIAMQHVVCYATDYQTTSALTWGYLGGRWGGFLISDDTFTLTDASDNYIVVERTTGTSTCSTSATDWDNTTDYARVYKVTTASGVVSAVEDHRGGPGGVQGGGGGTSGSGAISSWKEPVRAASTGNGTLSTAFENGDTLDGVTLATGDRILLKDQSTGSQNGIYVVNASGAPTRAVDADSGGELVGATVFVSEGTANADKVFACTTNATITVGSTSLVFSQGAFQPLDSDLTTIAGLTATTDSFMQSKASAWASRTVAQVSADLQATGLVTDAVGFRTIPQNSKSADYTTVAADSGKHILHPSADTTARAFTIDSNANVAYPLGTAITFVNQNSAGVVTIAITSDTMRLAGAGTIGSRTLAANGIATALKITSTEWIISGTGLT